MFIGNKFEEEVINLVKQTEERHLAKRKVNITKQSISKYFTMKDSFQKGVPQKEFLKDLGLLIVKNNFPIQFVESMWLKWLTLHLCPKLNFPSKRQFSQETLRRLVEKTKQLYVLFASTECHFATTSFDLWISKGAYDVFALVIYFLGKDWQPKHVTIGLFEMIEITHQALAKSLTDLLDKYGLMKKIIVYVKDDIL